MKHPRRIAHILPFPGVGGTEHAALRVAQATEGPEFHSLFYCRADAPLVHEFLSGAGFETVPYQAVEPSYRHPRNFLRASYELARDMRRRKVDLVHCADVLAAHYTAVAARLAGRRVLCHVRNRLDHISRRDQTFLFPVDRFAFVSADTWRRFGYRVPRRRGVVIYDGVDLPDVSSRPAPADVRREFAIPDSCRLIGMVARVAPQKDYETLVRAAAQVVATTPDVRFLVVGDNSVQPEHREHFACVRQWLADYQMEPFFLFAGYRSDIGRLLQAMDVFVLSTHLEGLPLVILEAAACGLPVVATAVDGIPEFIIDGQTGLLFPHEDAAQLGAHLLKLLSDRSWAGSLGAAGRETIRLRFSQERFADNLRALYRDLLGGNARPERRPERSI